MRAVARRVALLGLLALAAGGGSGKVGVQWESGAPEDKWTAVMIHQIGSLRRKRGYPQKPDEGAPLKTAIERAQLLDDCLRAESECFAFWRKRPDSLTAMHLWLYARNVSDQAANDVLVDSLNSFPVLDREAPMLPDGHTPLKEYVALAQRRALRRNPMHTETPQRDLESIDLSMAAGDFAEYRY